MASFWVAESAGYESHGWRKRKGGKIRDGAFQRMQQVVIWVDWVPGYDAGMRSEESWRAYYVHTRSSYARLWYVLIKTRKRRRSSIMVSSTSLHDGYIIGSAGENHHAGN
ncbi:hypothetical protein AnigIFM63604_005540 [Aspergillus niger]|uniref:Uncharacterized protein n=1 Tax=Aspergillus niger TaxID=5061 RepID=A0A9W5ZXM9_ASPNG|nr:hypothetical protein AnigIFM63604_005540 [Aspergillus niger]